MLGMSSNLEMNGTERPNVTIEAAATSPAAAS
jgi:hypothetical protein